MGKLIAGTDDKTLLIPSTVQIELVPLPESRGGLLAVAVVIVLVTLGLAWKSSLLRDGDKGTPLSLAKTQMCWWFLHVLVAFLLISAVTGAIDTIPPSMLVLMGISAATTTGAAAVDASRPAATGTASRFFLLDLITDANGVSLYRLQMVGWTVVLSCVFWGSVWEKLVMPDFDSTLLTLMGISSGTYLGMKSIKPA